MRRHHTSASAVDIDIDLAVEEFVRSIKLNHSAGILIGVVGPHQERVIYPRQTENADKAVELLNDVARQGIARLAAVRHLVDRSRRRLPALCPYIERKGQLPLYSVVRDHDFWQQLERIVEGARLRKSYGALENSFQASDVDILVEGCGGLRRFPRLPPSLSLSALAMLTDAELCRPAEGRMGKGGLKCPR